MASSCPTKGAIIVEDGVCLGQRCPVLSGVWIDTGAVVAVGAVVMHKCITFLPMQSLEERLPIS